MAILQIRTAFYLPDGIYGIGIKERFFLTDMNSSPGRHVYITRPNKEKPKQQQWPFQSHEDERVSIVNKESGLYLSYDGFASLNRLLVLSETPCLWRLSLDEERGFIEALDEDGQSIFRVGISLPKAALMLPGKDSDRTWTFNNVQDFSDEPGQYRLPFKKADLCH